MQQHQQQLRNQRQTTTPGTRPGQTQSFTSPQQFATPNLHSNRTSPLNKSFSPTNDFKPEKLLQPNLSAPIPNVTRDINMPLTTTNPPDLDVSEEDLQDFLSQKDLATTLAENLLKHFGSDEIDVKEEAETTQGLFFYKKKLIYLLSYYKIVENTLSSGPFSPSNIEPVVQNKQEVSNEPVKRKTEYSIQDSFLSLKSEPLWELESLHPSERRLDSDYSIDMEAKKVLDLCKYVIVF